MKQLTLGELTGKVMVFAKYHGEDKKELKEQGKVFYDFGDFYPTEINSWRGDYAQLALNYISEGDYEVRIKKPVITVLEFLKLLNDTFDTDFEGYKGGTWTAHNKTNIWVAEWGSSGHTIVVDVTSHYGALIIQTAYGRY
jgi:hypothetical protein